MIEEEIYYFNCPLLIRDLARGTNENYSNDHYNPLIMGVQQNPDSNKKMTIIERVWTLEKNLGIDLGWHKTNKQLAGITTDEVNRIRFKQHLNYIKRKSNGSGK